MEPSIKPTPECFGLFQKQDQLALLVPFQPGDVAIEVHPTTEHPISQEE